MDPGELHACVLDEDELPIPGVTLQLDPATQVETGDDGCATIPLAPGSWRLVATKAGFKGVTYEGIEVRAGETRELPMVLDAKDYGCDYG